MFNLFFLVERLCEARSTGIMAKEGPTPNNVQKVDKMTDYPAIMAKITVKMAYFAGSRK
jgi:hypothetical protein